MEEREDTLVYYCGQLRSAWARRKAEAYLRILLEEEERRFGPKQDQQKKKAAALNANRRFSSSPSDNIA